MTDPTVADLPYGSVDSYADILRRTARRTELVDTGTVGLITGIARDVALNSTDKVIRILNAIEARGVVEKEFDAQDPTGLNYGRGDEGQDPQPVAGRSPAHVGAVTELGLVDETEPTSTGLVYAANQARQTEADGEPGACAECGGAVKVVDNQLVHVNEVGGRLLLESHEAWVEVVGPDPNAACAAQDDGHLGSPRPDRTDIPCVPECGGGRQCRCQGGWS
jgi:hypothetical protein